MLLVRAARDLFGGMIERLRRIVETVRSGPDAANCFAENVERVVYQTRNLADFILCQHAESASQIARRLSSRI